MTKKGFILWNYILFPKDVYKHKFLILSGKDFRKLDCARKFLARFGRRTFIACHLSLVSDRRDESASEREGKGESGGRGGGP